MPTRPILCIALLGMVSILGACADDATYPQLLPDDALLAEPDFVRNSSAAAYGPDATAPLLGRAEALRQRARRMRATPVIEPAQRNRMNAAIARRG